MFVCCCIDGSYLPLHQGPVMRTESFTVESIRRSFESLADPSAIEGMARLGIVGAKVYGIKIPVLRALAKEIGRNHDLALELWCVNSRETRVLASMIDNPKQVTNDQMESWVRDFDSWEVCDQVIMNDFEKHPLAWEKAVEWSAADTEFVKRAGFVMMARLAVSDKNAPDAAFEPFFELIRRDSDDKRNFVKKAVNWALRQIGKRNRCFQIRALALAEELCTMDSATARWIGSDARRELSDDTIIARIKP
jgi:3-methyladenine DNA glycosylase AlkD